MRVSLMEAINMKNEVITIVVAVGFFGSILGATPALASRATDRYQIGYDDGCAGRTVSGPHTSDYENGYAAGQAACVNQGGHQDQGGRQDQGTVCQYVVNCNPSQQQAQEQQQNGG
jgi:hypothetical protein